MQGGDVDSYGISFGASKITLNGGAIKSEADNDTLLTHDAVSDASCHKANAPDTTAATMSSIAFTGDPAMTTPTLKTTPSRSRLPSAKT